MNVQYNGVLSRLLTEATPSRTAYRVALRRAAHQVFDSPIVFLDPLALRILGLNSVTLQSSDLRAPQRPSSRSLRAFIVARSRFAEDALAQSVAEGFSQYVLLGAGLDTFAYRNPYPGLRVFEVDHPATQAWKRDLLQANGIVVPDTCAHVAVDFERDDLMQRLSASGFQQQAPTLFAWLGVVPYLTHEAMCATLDALGALPTSIRLVLDYGLPRAMLPASEQLALDSLSARVASAGEPFRQFFSPEQIAQELRRVGLCVLEDLNSVAINTRFFAGSTDAGLRVLSTGGHLLRAERTQTSQGHRRACG